MKVHLTSLIKSINQKENKNFDCYPADPIFALPNNEQVVWEREFSSAGLEHLPYKQRVGGSNPSTPTE